MWSRAELKEMAKMSFKNNYIITVVASLILAILTGELSGSRYTGNYVKSIYDGSGNGIIPIFNIPNYILGVFAVTSVIIIVIRLFFTNPLIVGGCKFFITNRILRANLGMLLYPFKNSYINTVKTMFLKDIYIFLWTLLFIIPGIIKTYSYRMVPYILAKPPTLKVRPLSKFFPIWCVVTNLMPSS